MIRDGGHGPGARLLFWLALAGMLFTGFMNPIANGPLIALLQSSVAPDMQGRVLSLVQSGAAAMMPLSLLVAGPVADALGVRVWYLIGGAACTLIGLLAFAVPAIMHIEQNDPRRQAGWKPGPEEASAIAALASEGRQ